MPIPPLRIGDLPGPRGAPLLGNLLQVDRERLHLQLERWAAAFGPIYRFGLASRRFVVFADPDAIAAVLRDRPDGFRRTERLEAIARETGFSGLFSSNGEAWKRQRPMVLAALDPTHVRAFFPTLATVTARLAGRWEHAARAGAAVDLQADLMRYTVDVTAGLAFGVDVNTIESTDEVIQAHLDQVFPALSRRLLAPVRYWRVVRLPRDRRLDRHLAALHRAVDDFIAAARRRLDADPARRAQPSNLIEAMLAARDRDASGITDADVRGNVLTMLLAGEDTTANTIAWMTWLLHRHPDVAARAADEARAVTGGAAQPARPEDLGRLAYLEACTHETMRLKPVGPINVLQAIRDTVVAGVALPAGTLVMCAIRPPALDPRHFPDPAVFRPERWLAADPAAVASAATSTKRVAMPFGAGPRMCPGRYLALAEIKMAVAMLLTRFEIESVAAPGGEPAERLNFTMAPVGLAMKLRVRSRISG